MYAYICLSLLAGFGVNVLNAQDTDSCHLLGGEIGECRLVHECPEVLKKLRDRSGKPFRPIRCGFEGLEEIVCCKIPLAANPEETDDLVIFDYKEDTWSTQKPSSTESPDFHGEEQPTPSPEGPKERAASKKCEEYSSKKEWTINTHIRNGDNAHPGEFPHMAALAYNNEEEEGVVFRCGGTLVSEQFVLTAAHCLTSVGGSKPVLARLGVTDLNSTKMDSLVTDYPVEKDYVHEKYNRTNNHNDIALIRLETPVTFSMNIYPACLSLELDNPSQAMIITGWGRVTADAKDVNNELLKASVVAVATEKCNVDFSRTASFRSRNPTGLLPSQMCAQDPKKISDTCQGDSGGPLQVALKGVDDMYTIIGITSYGKNCGVDSPGIYTRVSSFLDWIEGIVWP